MPALRSAVRHLAGAPWLTAVIVASLALGTGANAAVYSAVDALLFRAPSGVVDASRIVDLHTSQLNGGTFGNSSYPDFLSAAAGRAKLDVLGFDVFVARALAPDRLIGTLIGACGAIALGLALIGVYGVMIDAVRRRRREFGLRAALGAGPIRIVMALVGSNLTPAVAGIAAGVTGALLLSRLAASVVYGLPTIDAALAAEVVLLLLFVVLASVAGPARRAAKVNPLLALRH